MSCVYWDGRCFNVVVTKGCVTESFLFHHLLDRFFSNSSANPLKLYDIIHYTVCIYQKTIVYIVQKKYNKIYPYNFSSMPFVSSAVWTYSLKHFIITLKMEVPNTLKMF